MILLIGILAFGLAMFCAGLLLGDWLSGAKIEPSEIPDRSYHSPVRYNPREDTSDAMYNEHGVHKLNPMLDR